MLKISDPRAEICDMLGPFGLKELVSVWVLQGLCVCCMGTVY